MTKKAENLDSALARVYAALRPLSQDGRARVIAAAQVLLQKREGA